MPRSVLNPKPSDYSGQNRLGSMALVIGIVLLISGLNAGGGWLATLLSSAGIGLIIGAGAVLLTASRNQRRATQMRSRNDDE